MFSAIAHKIVDFTLQSCRKTRPAYPQSRQVAMPFRKTHCREQAVLLPTVLLKSVLACTTHTKALGFAYKTFFRAFMGFANIQLPIANAREVFR